MALESINKPISSLAYVLLQTGFASNAVDKVTAFARVASKSGGGSDSACGIES